MKLKRLFVPLVIVSAIISVICVIVISPWVLIIIGSELQARPPVPEVQYGEFPFQLVYEIGEEQIIVEDTLICKYTGIESGSNGKIYKWRQYLASNHEEEHVLLWSEGEQKLYFPVGSADYFMGAADERMYANGYDYHQFPRVFYDAPNSGVELASGDVTIEGLLEEHQIKLISWQCAPPIRNTFK